MTRMRERFLHGAPARDAVVRGSNDSARVVTAAALIMIAVFFGVALGVAVDAFVVRMTLVPAVMALLGERAWGLPRWLEPVVPRVDLEGTSVAEEAARELARAQHADPPVTGARSG